MDEVVIHRLKERFRPMLRAALEQIAYHIRAVGFLMSEAEIVQQIMERMKSDSPEVFTRAMVESDLNLTQEELREMPEVFLRLLKEIKHRSEN